MFFTMTFDGFRSSMAAIVDALNFTVPPKGQFNRNDSSTARLVLAVMLCVVLTLDISQLAFAVAGAVIFTIMQSFNTVRKHPHCTHQDTYAMKAQGKKEFAQRPRPRGQQQEQKQCPQASVAETLSRKPRHEATSKIVSAPIAPPTFQSTGWDAEFNELVDQISPTAAGDKAVQQLALLVKRVIRPVLAEMEVLGFASSNFTCGKAFGVAVPEVDVIVNISPAALARRLQQRSGPAADDIQSNPYKLQKWAIRTCTDRLVATGNFKFRRSAFCGQEPKVTLLAAASTGIFDEAIPFDFSVNTVTPLYSAALLTECGQMESRAKALILLARRWAKDRGICHAPKGHLTPYAWSLLAIYFLQVGVSRGGSLLPPLKDFAASSGLMTKQQASKPSSKCTTSAGEMRPLSATVPITSSYESEKMSVGALFKDFINFYHSQFDWRGEAVSVRLGARLAPDLTLPLHIVVQEDSSLSKVAPSVEDPFDISRNLGGHMTAESISRLHEELARAQVLCAREASLTELLDPWVPAEMEARNLPCKDRDDDASTRAPSDSALSSPSRSPPSTPTKGSPRTPSSSTVTCENPAPKSTTGEASLPPWRRAK